MKNFKKIFAVALALAMLLALCACGDDKKSDKQNDKADSTTASYEVKVLDGQGNPMTEGVVVKFLKDGQQVAMQKTNDKGIASKELEKGNYTVELMFTDSSLNANYDASAAVLSADKTSLVLTLINEVGSESSTLVVGEQEFNAPHVNVGSTNVPVAASVRNYFIFTPTEAGTYAFSVSNNDIKIGYYGAPHFVQSMSAVDVIDNVITMSISAGTIGGSYVLGLDGLSADTKTVLNIIRTGDPEITISDLPWTEYKTTHTPTPFTLSIPSGKSLKFVDVSSKATDNVIVKNDADGYYHYGTADGPIVYVCLGKKLEHLSLKVDSFSLQTVIEGNGQGGGAPIREYFFDADGNFLKKEDYTDILRTYFENMDSATGVYPLNADLAYILQNGCNSWWTADDPDYIFSNCNPEIGWMFALCYVG